MKFFWNSYELSTFCVKGTELHMKRDKISYYFALKGSKGADLYMKKQRVHIKKSDSTAGGRISI